MTFDRDPKFIGSRLLALGFRAWFLYLFKYINGSPFIEQELHKELFEQVERTMRREDTRICINLSPRSGKTTINIWMVVYILTVNPKAQIIYTSFNQDLLRQIAQQVQSIMTHPIYQAMYGTYVSEETEEVDPIDDFWRDYLLQTTGKIKFSSRKIFTPQGGVVLFNSIGAAITGFGAGLRNPKDGVPDGGLFIDDPDKPTDIRSETIRNKTHTYYVETLLSRLNNSHTIISVTQQRLHIDDMTGFLVEQYGFKVFKFPLIADDGTCNLGNQYTPERIKELMVNNYVFQSQYQQEPIMLGGGVFKLEWFVFYKDEKDARYRKIFITADTAVKTKEWNDYTAIGVWGLTINNKLRLLDYIHGRFEIPELQSTMLNLWEKWKYGIGNCRCSEIVIEDKASGMQLIQQLRRIGGLPIHAVKPDKDKLSRAYDAIPQIAAGNVELPENERNRLSAEILKDILAFSADMSHKFDDGVDCMLYAVDIAYSRKGSF